jgi:hypothetical protein
MENIDFIPDHHILGTIEYVFMFHKCPYCHKYYEKVPEAADYYKHLLVCVEMLETEKLRQQS